MTGADDHFPAGWARTILGKLRLDRSRTVDPRRTPEKLFELYSVPSFPSGRPEVVTGGDIGSAKRTLIPGTVIVCKINPRINRVWVVEEHTSHPKIGSSEWIPFFPIDGIEPHYLAYFCKQDAFRNFLASNVSGVGGSLMRVRPATLDTFPIPIAPFDEQKRIVSSLDSYLSCLDDADASLKCAKINLQRYRASVLKAAVEGRLVPTEAELARQEGRDYEPAKVLLDRILAERRRLWEEAELARLKAKGKPPKGDSWKSKCKEPESPDFEDLPDLPSGWCWSTVEQLGDIVTGTTPPTSDPANYGGSLPFVKPTDLDAGYEVRTARQHLSEIGAGLSRIVPPGGVMVTCIGATIGKTGLARMECATNQQINTAIPEEPLRSSRYLYWYFSSPAGQAAIVGNASSTTLPILNKSRFASLAVPLPPHREAVRITREVERLLSLSEESEKLIEMSLLRCNRLRQAILGWAFAGKLSDQDSSDEPAQALLDRIREAKPVAKSRKRGWTA